MLLFVIREKEQIEKLIVVFQMFSILRIPTRYTSIIHRLPIYLHRISASSSSSSSSNETKTKDKNDDDDDEQESHEQEEASVAAMIGPYMSSKQIAFHTGQFDSDQIQKKNKQAFLVKFHFFSRRRHRFSSFI